MWNMAAFLRSHFSSQGFMLMPRSLSMIVLRLIELGR